MKKLTIRMFSSYILLILIISCRSTDIYFDLNTQSIISCNQRKLTNIIIECDSSNLDKNDCFYALSSKNASDKVHISDINTLYNISDTIFYNNNGYKITFDGGGDDGATSLKIWFNNQGKVNKTDKSDCD